MDNLTSLSKSVLIDMLKEIISSPNIVVKNNQAEIARLRHMNIGKIYRKYKKEELIDILLKINLENDVKNSSEGSKGESLLEKRCSSCGLFKFKSSSEGLQICASCITNMEKEELDQYFLEQLEKIVPTMKSEYSGELKSNLEKVNKYFTRSDLEEMLYDLQNNKKFSVNNSSHGKKFILDFFKQEMKQCIHCYLVQPSDQVDEFELCGSCIKNMSKEELAIYYLEKLRDLEEGEMSEYFRSLRRQTALEVSRKLSRDNLIDMFYELQYDKRYLKETPMIDYHGILNFYTEKNIDEFSGKKIELQAEEVWREYVPTYLKRKYPEWKQDSLEDVYKKTKDIVEKEGREAREQLMGFLTDLSQVIFEEQDDVEEDETSDISSEVEAFIMYKVEMIILPHLEVINQIEQAKGAIQFVDVNLHHFSEQLKEEVKCRDQWKCVICNGETHLHVHHKIPRRYGGVNHIDNLVTLCASCHGAVETADVKKAFQKGISNYRKNLGRNIREEEITHDKEVLKEEVEETLDKILAKALGKDDRELASQVVGVMDKLKIVFYE